MALSRCTTYRNHPGTFGRLELKSPRSRRTIINRAKGVMVAKLTHKMRARAGRPDAQIQAAESPVVDRGMPMAIAGVIRADAVVAISRHRGIDRHEAPLILTFSRGEKGLFKRAAEVRLSGYSGTVYLIPRAGRVGK